MADLISSYGIFGLFLWSFLSATILPLSSEAALAVAIKFGISKTDAIIWASAGNCLACGLNYYLGAYFRVKMQKKLDESRFGRKSLEWMQKYGLWSLLASWLPFIGDPLTIVAGMARVNFLWFVLIVFSLRILRYIVIAGIM